MALWKSTAAWVLATCQPSLVLGTDEESDVREAWRLASCVAMAARGEVPGEAVKKSMLRPRVRPASHTHPSRP